MPAKRKTRADRMREQFGRMYAVGKATNHLTDVDVAESIGVSIATLWKRKKDPSKLTVNELTILVSVLHLNPEDVAKLITM